MKSFGESTRHLSTTGVRSALWHVREATAKASATGHLPPSLPLETKLRATKVKDSTIEHGHHCKRLHEIFKSLLQHHSHGVSLPLLERMRQLVVCLQQQPEVAGEAWTSGIVPWLLELKRSSHHEEVIHQTNLALALLGHVPDCQGRGLRILSIDGGGVRWVRYKSIIGLVVIVLYDKLTAPFILYM